MESRPESSESVQSNAYIELLKEFDELVKNSADFESNFTEFKTNDNRIKEIGDTDDKKVTIVKHANGTRVILHEKVKTLIEEYLKLKQNHGTLLEQTVYKGMDTPKFIERLLLKRPLVFFGTNDTTILRDSNQATVHPHWDLVGVDNPDKKDVPALAEYMSYDEIAISALIGVSVPTYFINSGDRYNCGIKSDENDYETEGVYIGLTGARFEKRDKMESLHVLVTENYHKAENGYGKKADEHNPKTQLLKVWAHFYDLEDGFPSYDELSPDEPKKGFVVYNRTTSPIFINCDVYKKRLEASILPFLYDAQLRAKEANKKAYCHVVGLGLGVWQITPDQAHWMLEVYEDLITHKLHGLLPDIGVIDFSWFPENSSLKLAKEDENGVTKLENIEIRFSRRDPAKKLDGNSHILVAMYAWDGNSFPGNEYWRGMLQASGDPAAACCSTIAELQNPYINKKFIKQIHFFPPPSSSQ